MKYSYALLALNSLFLVGLQPQIASASTLYDGTGIPENQNPQWLAPGGIKSNGVPLFPAEINNFQTVDPVSGAFTLQTNDIDPSMGATETSGYLT